MTFSRTQELRFWTELERHQARLARLLRRKGTTPQVMSLLDVDGVLWRIFIDRTTCRIVRIMTRAEGNDRDLCITDPDHNELLDLQLDVK